ncbi:MAG: hypothetical protein QNJ90_03565 [Planctomycetota bacterium]|nr:hypothetical protein [Planctomycetota bacterium]
MLHLDDVQLYDLSEAGGLLFKDPARLAREARLRRLPATRVEAGLALPAPWVDAEAGVSDADPIALSTYWLARLAPPSANARRPRRSRESLEAAELLTPAEAARRLCATDAALARLDSDGTVPSLRVDDEVRYDAVLVDLVAREDEGEDVVAEAQERRTAVRAWARFEYGADETLPPPVARPRPAAPAPEPTPLDEDAPKAFEIPTDLGLDDIGELDEPPGPGLMEIDGFETVDED